MRKSSDGDKKMTFRKLPTLAALVTPFPCHIEYAAPLAEARRLMDEHHIHHLVVMKEGDIHGVLSERELQHHGALYGLKESGMKDNVLVVGDICSANVIAADIHDPLDKVLEAMAEKHLGSIVVLREGELAGIFTTTDVCRFFARFLQHTFRSDETPDIVA